MRCRPRIAWALVLLLSCAAQPRVYTAADDTTEVELARGDEIELVLEGNPTTGFAWIVTDIDTEVVEQIGEATFVPESDAIGAPGEFTFRFVAIGPGTGRLVLDYERAFEDVEPLATFEMTLAVR